MFYSIPFNNVATGASAGTFKTMAAAIVPDTAGRRIRVRALNIGPADAAAADRNIAVRIERIADVSVGTAGTSTAISAANVPKKDTQSQDSIASGAVNYTVEPTTYETNPLWADEFNDRGGIIKEWDQNGAPKALQDQLIAVRCAPRTANASNVSGCLEIEVY